MKTARMSDSTLCDDQGEDLCLQIVIVNNITHEVDKIGCRTQTEFKTAMRELTQTFLTSPKQMVSIHLSDWRDI